MVSILGFAGCTISVATFRHCSMKEVVDNRFMTGCGCYANNILYMKTGSSPDLSVCLNTPITADFKHEGTER